MFELARHGNEQRSMAEDANGNWINDVMPAPPTPGNSIPQGSGSCSNLEGAGTDPNGSVTPDFIGQTFQSTTDDSIWSATDLTNSGWVNISSVTPCANKSGKNSPVGVVTSDFTGQTYQDTDTGNVWQSDAAGTTAWTLISQPAVPTNVSIPDGTLLSFIYDGSDTVKSITFPNLISMGGVGVTISNSSSLQVISFPALDACNNFEMVANPSLVEIDIPVATGFSTFNVSQCSILSSMDVTFVQSIGTSLTIFDTGLTELNFTSLSAPLPTATNISSNFALTSLTMGGQALLDGGDYNFSDNALDETSVDLILAAGIAGGMTSGSIALIGGTNSAPSLTGQANVLILQGNGVTVSTN